MSSDGYRIPAEWQCHSQTIMALPGRESCNYWPCGSHEQMVSDVIRVAKVIARFERVTMYVGRSQFRQAERMLECSR